MSFLLRSAIKLEGLLFSRHFDRITKDPRVTQTQYLLNIVNNNRNTLYGKEHGFSEISCEEDYRGNVPINQYQALEPYINKIANGQQNILTADAITMFNLTSGTSDKPKYIPVTAMTRKRTVRLNRLWLYRTLLDHPEFLSNFNLTITGAAVEGYTSSLTPFGSMSGLIYRNLARPFRSSFVLPFFVSDIKSYDLRYYVMSRLALQRDISFLATPNPSTLLKLAEVGIAHQQEIIRSIHDGTLQSGAETASSDTDREIINALDSSLSPDTSRARFLENVLQEHGSLIPRHCWPSLKLLACWLGGSAGYQASKLAPYYGDVTRRDLGYLASEGCMTLPVSDNSPAGVLALSNNYYEFIPEEYADTANPPVLSSHELEAGKLYRVLLTNESGLYRYDINDILKVEGFYNKTPLLAFVRKTKNILNITGEKVHVNQFIMAIQDIQSSMNVEIRSFRIAANQQLLRYDILLMMDDAVPAGAITALIIPAIDECLSKLNIEYAQKRGSGRLKPPCMHVMDETWAEHVKRAAIDSGKRDIQYKWEYLSDEMTALDLGHIKYTVEPGE